MCGRYTAAKDFSELIKLVGGVMARVPFFAARYNIAPTQMVTVIYKELRLLNHSELACGAQTIERQ